MQPAGDGVLMNRHAEPARDLITQVDAAPADNAMDLRIGTGQHEIKQFSPLKRGQGRLAARRPA